MSSTQREESLELSLDFTKLASIASTGQNVVPVVAQDSRSGDVLIIAYANELALQETIKRGVAVFWSTSRNELWVKGESSGDLLRIREIRVNCEQNSILYRVVPEGQGACHTKMAGGYSRPTCFYRKILEDGKTLAYVCGMK